MAADRDDIKTLATGVANLGEAVQELLGKEQVLLAAVLALARTHPDPAAFAGEFRRCWTLLGSPHANSEAGKPFLDGIGSLLDLLDEQLHVPPKVRPLT